MNIIDIIRGLVEDLHLSDKERLDMTLEVPEASMERLVRDIKIEWEKIGFIMVGLSDITEKGQDMKITYPSYHTNTLGLAEGTLNVKHSNRFALYPTINEKEFR